MWPSPRPGELTGQSGGLQGRLRVLKLICCLGLGVCKAAPVQYNGTAVLPGAFHCSPAVSCNAWLHSTCVEHAPLCKHSFTANHQASKEAGRQRFVERSVWFSCGRCCARHRANAQQLPRLQQRLRRRSVREANPDGLQNFAVCIYALAILKEASRQDGSAGP